MQVKNLYRWILSSTPGSVAVLRSRLKRAAWKFSLEAGRPRAYPFPRFRLVIILFNAFTILSIVSLRASFQSAPIIFTVYNMLRARVGSTVIRLRGSASSASTSSSRCSTRVCSARRTHTSTAPTSTFPPPPRTPPSPRLKAHLSSLLFTLCSPNVPSFEFYLFHSRTLAYGSTYSYS